MSTDKSNEPQNPERPDGNAPSSEDIDAMGATLQDGEALLSSPAPDDASASGLDPLGATLQDAGDDSPEASADLTPEGYDPLGATLQDGADNQQPTSTEQPADLTPDGYDPLGATLQDGADNQQPTLMETPADLTPDGYDPLGATLQDGPNNQQPTLAETPAPAPASPGNFNPLGATVQDAPSSTPPSAPPAAAPGYDPLGATVNDDAAPGGMPSGYDPMGATLQDEANSNYDIQTLIGATITDEAEAGGVGMTLKEGAVTLQDGDLIAPSEALVEGDLDATVADSAPPPVSKAPSRKPSAPPKTTDSQIASRISISSRVMADFSNMPKAVLQQRPMNMPHSDYELNDLLGVGGMGMVYLARQTCMDRDIAVKMIKAEGAGDKNVRSKFLAEAVVTGVLDHPNIVPVVELGRNEKGDLFYSMKAVKGDAWSDVIKTKTLEENLEALEAVSNAIAFAHDHGIVHRDLKPENVMLGGYGEVLVMDWGLAAAYDERGKGERLGKKTGVCGTPAYMAPEMAIGDGSRIGPCSDIYLLGAMLFEAIAGFPPHTGKDIRECLMNSAQNVVRETEVTGELMDIALKAMATKTEDRYETVPDFIKAIKDYEAHRESISLGERAEKEFRRAEGTRNYDEFNMAMYGLQEAVKIWDGNRDARSNLSAIRLSYAGLALERGDLDLVQSLLVESTPPFEELKAALAKAREERERQERNRRLAKKLIIGLGCTVVVIIAVAFIVVYGQMQEADAARKNAEEAQEEATKSAEAAKKSAKAAEDALASQRAQAAAENKLKELSWRKTEAEAKSLQKAAATDQMPVELDVQLPADVKLPMRLIPDGIFTMGSPPQEANRVATESLHDVKITQPYYMAAFEMTQEQWIAITGDKTSGPKDQNGEPVKGVQPSFFNSPYVPRNPVESVSWDQIAKLIGDMNAMIGEGKIKGVPAGFQFALPTEAQWEYAARAGSVTSYYDSDDEEGLFEYGWVYENSGKKVIDKKKAVGYKIVRTTSPTGLKKPNAWGLYDMHGNVAEWCRDTFMDNYYLVLAESAMNKAIKKRDDAVKQAVKDGMTKEEAENTIPISAGATVDPTGPEEDGRSKIVRGGAFSLRSVKARSAYRSNTPRETKIWYLGFRLILQPKTDADANAAEKKAPAAEATK